jgi:hypothetical protein
VGELAATQAPPPKAPAVPETHTPKRSTPAHRLQLLATFFSMPLRRFLYVAPSSHNPSNAQCIAPSHHFAVLMHHAAFLHGTANRRLSCASPRRHLPERAHEPRRRFTDAMRKHERVRTQCITCHSPKKHGNIPMNVPCHLARFCRSVRMSHGGDSPMRCASTNGCAPSTCQDNR